MVGCLFGGVLFDGPGGVAACLVAAGVIASGAVLMPFALRLLGVADRPGAEEPTPAPAARPPLAEAEPREAAAGSTPLPANRAVRPRLTRLAAHAAVFVAAQIVAAFAGLSWPWHLLSGRRGLAEGMSGPPGGLGDIEHVLYKVGTVWTVVLLVEAAWTLWNVARPRRHPV